MFNIVTLAAFQRALCDLIASPDLSLAARAGTSDVFGRYDLSERERIRLRQIVWQPGMSTNCTLYRSNRVTPIYTLLHHTCFILGDRFKHELDDYWEATELRDLEFKREIARFAKFLRERIADGRIANPFIEEVLDFEMAANELRFAPRRQILQQLAPAAIDDAYCSPGALRVHPLIRVVRFRHDPGEVLSALANGQLPGDLAERDTYLLLSVVSETMAATEITPDMGHLLWRIQTGDGGDQCGFGVNELLQRGLLSPA